MADIYRADIARVELDGDLVREHIGSLLATGDKKANRYGVAVYRDGKAVSIADKAIIGYFIRPEEDTLVINGKTSGNTGYVELPQSCYTQEGAFALALKLSGGDVVQTVRIIDGRVALTQDGELVDPGTTVPTLDDILGKIAECEAAASAANTAAAEATEATTSVLGAAQTMSKTAAPAVIPMATGDGIASARDSADRPLAGLHLYGKTTQDGTPSTATPVALVNAAVGSVKVDIRGKNLFNASALSHATSSHTGDESRLVLTQSANYGTATYSMRAEPNTTYTVSFRLAAVAEGHPFLFSFAVGDDAYQTASATGLVTASCTASDAGGTLYLKLRPTGSSGVTGSVTLENIMVEIGAVATAFEPYKDGGSVTVSTPNGLPGIPVSSGGNYTDGNGQQWLCDEIDLGRGVYVQRVASTKMQNLNLYAVSNTSSLAIGYHVDTYGGAVRDVGMCNALPRRTSTDQWLSADSCVAVNNSGPLVQIAGCTTLEQLNAYLSTHEIIVLSGLATPVEIALPSAAINAYNQMQSYKPTTTAINSAGIGMGVEYIADTQTYIDNKLAAIAAAMLEN